MTTLQEAARKSFEVWKKTGSCFYLSRNNAPGSDLDGYQDAYTQGQWIAWQAALVQQVEPTDDQLVKGVKAMRLFVTKNSVADFKLGYMAALAAAPAPQAPQPAQACKPLCELCVKRGYNFCANVAQTTPITVQSAQPVAQLLTDDEILTIAHRKATRYTHAVAPGQVTYGFSVVHLLDFVRAILDEIPAQPVAQPLSEAVIREIADCIVSNLDSRKGVINLDLDDDLVEEIMQEMCDTIAHGIREVK